MTDLTPATTAYADHPGHRCPKCDSPAPHQHPAVQCEGEVELCTHDYHLIPTNMNRTEYISRVLAKRAKAEAA
jgi:hypothetical protein